MFQKISQYLITVGINDSTTLTEKYSNDKIIKTVCNIQNETKTSFSISTQKGGYVYNNGVYTGENRCGRRLFRHN